jgi:hypothetical protein
VTLEIKQFGLQRSGTNFLKVVLQENYDVNVLTHAGGWKHGRYEVPELLGRELDIAVIVKNIWSWLDSFYRWDPDFAELSFEEFLRRPLELRSDAGADRIYRADNPVRYWNEMNRHWLSLSLERHRSFVVRYEDMLEHAEHAVGGLALALGLSRTREQFYVPPSSLEAYYETYPPEEVLARGRPFDGEFYAERKYLQRFDQASRELVTAELDRELMEYLGYQE